MDFRAALRLPDSHPKGPISGCFVIGEVAQAHDGSVGFAHAFIDAIASAGADAVKFQTHIAAAESTPAETFRVKFSRQDATRYEYWKRMEFTEEQWVGLKHHADDRGLAFLSSPFSLEAVELLERVQVAAWKVASGEVGNQVMFERMAQSQLPMLLSTGMSPLAEIDAAVGRVQARKLPLAVLQCSTSYPCPPEKIGLNLLPFFRTRYGSAVGLSDHSGTIYPGLAAAALGCDVLEVHVTLSREMFGPDVAASVTTGELGQLTQGIRYIEKILAHPVDKDLAAAQSAELRKLFTKSLVARSDLPAGTIISAQHLALKKPGTGLSEASQEKILGKCLRRSVRADELFSEADFE
jgi:N,N'-diacetyllegionaminate synthase